MERGSASWRRLLKDIQRLLGILLYRDVADPRLEGLSITRVEGAGRHQVTVWVHKPGKDFDPEVCLEVLERLRPHFEHELRRAIPRRRLPALEFRWDEAFDRSSEVLDLLRQLERSG